MYDNVVALDRPRQPSGSSPQASESSLRLSLAHRPESSFRPSREPRLEHFPDSELGLEVTGCLHLESRSALPTEMGQRDDI